MKTSSRILLLAGLFSAAATYADWYSFTLAPELFKELHKRGVNPIEFAYTQCSRSDSPRDRIKGILSGGVTGNGGTEYEIQNELKDSSGNVTSLFIRYRGPFSSSISGATLDTPLTEAFFKEKKGCEKMRKAATKDAKDKLAKKEADEDKRLNLDKYR